MSTGRTPQPPVILIAGPAGHGKTTACEILVKATHLRGASCSEIIFHFLALRKGVPVAYLQAQDKETLRPELIHAGNWLCGDIGTLEAATGPDAPKDEDLLRVPSTLIRSLYMNGRNIIDGVRRKLELNHAIEAFHWCGVRTLTIWIFDPRKPLIKDNTEDLAPLCDEQIENSGTPEDLEKKLMEVLVKHFPQ